MGRGAPECVVIGEELYQWDLNREILVPPGTTEVHFALTGQSNAYGIEPSEEGTAAIPNLLLQSGKSIECWTVDEERTTTHTHFRVRLRPKPPQYLYTPTEITNVRQLISDALDALEYADISGLPTIEGVTLVGELYLTDFGILPLEDDDIEAAYGDAASKESEEEGEDE